MFRLNSKTLPFSSLVIRILITYWKDYCKTLRIFRIHEVKISKVVLKNSRIAFRSTI
uniref:Uncharacterized protein n=1 Tax=Myoviridae sp. ctLnO19 TaxID=2825085 RepID=A0A8S5P2F7_9CAUD|nr:MAG TPA: hypothetical protein [Myoviridae sp. ctLnO19]